MPTDLCDRILGSLAAAGMGDALGAATEVWSRREIFAAHGGPLRDFVAPPPDTFAGVNGAGRAQVTDDASQMYYLAQTLIETGGSLSSEAWLECLLRWADGSRYRAYMGPTTEAAIRAIREGRDLKRIGTIGDSPRQGSNVGTTNGSAMRVAPVGLIHPGDPEAACRDALITCLPTHATQIAIAATCAVAAGVAHALSETATVASVAEACVAGAHYGEALAEQQAKAGAVRIVAGPSVALRTEFAVELAHRATSLEEALHLLEAYIGTSVYASESVPTAIGLFVFAEGDPLEAMVGGANVGNDTDTIATIAGALAGALRGFGALPPAMFEAFKRANREDFDVEALASGLARIAAGQTSRGDF